MFGLAWQGPRRPAQDWEDLPTGSPTKYEIITEGQRTPRWAFYVNANASPSVLINGSGSVGIGARYRPVMDPYLGRQPLRWQPFLQDDTPATDTLMTSYRLVPLEALNSMITNCRHAEKSISIR